MLADRLVSPPVESVSASDAREFESSGGVVTA